MESGNGVRVNTGRPGAKILDKSGLVFPKYPKREYFKGYHYYHLENLNTRRLFEESPSDFVNVRNARLIIDEVQWFPELLPLIQTVVDEQKIR
jgi:hypothetical protein